MLLKKTSLAKRKKIHNTTCVGHHYNKKQSDFDVQFDDLNSTC
jgi:hypothetical protein